MFRRRTLLRLGFRAGTALAYFGDPDLGQQRRDAVLSAVEPFGMRTRYGPLVAWLRSLNAGELTAPPTREQMLAARVAARQARRSPADATAATDDVLDPDADEAADEAQDAGRLTVVHHPNS